MNLIDICEEIIEIEDGLLNGTIDFQYDNLMSVMKGGHPMEFLDNILADVYMPLVSNKPVSVKQIEILILRLTDFQNDFKVNLKKPIKKLKNFLKEHPGEGSFQMSKNKEGK